MNSKSKKKNSCNAEDLLKDIEELIDSKKKISKVFVIEALTCALVTYSYKFGLSVEEFLEIFNLIIDLKKTENVMDNFFSKPQEGK